MSPATVDISNPEHTHDDNGIHVRNLSVTYGQVTAVNDASLTVPPGQVVAMVGGNGAGKSTLLATIAGLVSPTTGSITVAGQTMSAADHSTHERAVTAERIRSHIGYCPDRDGLFTRATLRETIAISLALHHKRDHWPHALLLAQRLELNPVLNEPLSVFSHGMARRASVLLACLTADPVLLLDEPFDGMDIRGSAITANLVHQAATSGCAVLITTHLPEALDGVAQSALVMRAGSIVYRGTLDSISGNEGRARLRRLLDPTPIPT